MIRSSGLLVRILCQWMSGKSVVGQRLVDAALDQIGRGLSMLTHFADLGGRHMAEDVPIKMNHAALPPSVWRNTLRRFPSDRGRHRR